MLISNQINKSFNKAFTKIIPLLYVIMSLLIVTKYTTFVFCDPIQNQQKSLDLFVQNGIDIFAYVAEWGVQWFWIMGIAFFTGSCMLTGTKKDVIRKMAFAMFIAWFVAIAVNQDTELVTNTFNKIRDTLFGTKN